MPHSTPDPIPSSEDRCRHERQEMRRRPGSVRGNHYFMQCMTCGREVEPINKDDPRVRGLHALPPLKDETISQRYWQDRFVRLRTQSDERRTEEREAYDAYLRTDWWRQKRAMRLEIDRHRCTAMLSGCTKVASEVHHITYEHCGDEPMFDLRSVCRSCHERLHEIEREIREARYGRAS